MGNELFCLSHGDFGAGYYSRAQFTLTTLSMMKLLWVTFLIYGSDYTHTKWIYLLNRDHVIVICVQLLPAHHYFMSVCMEKVFWKRWEAGQYQKVCFLLKDFQQVCLRGRMF